MVSDDDQEGGDVRAVLIFGDAPFTCSCPGIERY